jgi:hypothetical protein
LNRSFAFLLCLFAPAGIALATPAPFTAEYITLRNGNELGRTTIEFKANGDSTWTMRSTTTGTAGLAKMAGLDVVEESILRWQNGRPETVRYDYRQDATFKKRQRHAELDWQTQQAHIRDGDSEHHYAISPGTLDRHAVTIALINDLSRSGEQFVYPVAGKDGVEDVTYERCGKKQIAVPAGSFDAECLERKRSRRTSTSWFAESAGWVPVQIEQVEKKGDTITLRLVSLKN